MGNCESVSKLSSKSTKVHRNSGVEKSRRSAAAFLGSAIVKGTFRSNIVLDTRCRYITDKYEIIKTLGEGKMGKVASARNIKTTYDKRKDAPPGIQVALKSAVMNKNGKHHVLMLRAEIDALKALDHPHCIKPYEVYVTCDRNLHLAFQFCTGGNLYSRFPKNIEGTRICFSEKDAAFIVYQLLSALAHMHANHLMHRDIKFENIMLDSPNSQVIKLVDFGASAFFKEGKHVCHHIGTVYTMAPEVLRGKYTEKADIWGVGVICYMMLSLTKPFYGSSRNVITQKILKGETKFYSPNWDSVSDSAKSFIRSLLTMDPDKRLSAVQAMKHPWIDEQYPTSEREASDEVVKGVHDSIVQYIEFNDMKKIGLNIIAHQMETDLIWELKKVFEAHCKNKDGTMKFPDFTVMIRKVTPDYDIDTIRQLFCKVTFDSKSKNLYFTEFLAAALGYQKDIVTMDRLWRAFDRLDHEKKGFITRENMSEILGSDYNQDRIDGIFEEQDSGRISFVGFYDSFLQ